MSVTAFRSSNQSNAWIAACTLVAALLCLTGCKPIQVNGLIDRVIPTNDRQWMADMKQLATAEIDDDEVLIHNIRNCQYVTESDYVLNYHDRKINLQDVESVDFILVPFKNKAIAHTMLSFGLRDGTYLCVSVEIRKELNESYSPLLGISNQFELVYLIADERDLVRVRTKYRDAQVYVYPTVATPEASRELLLDVLRRVNELAARPEFYNTFTNNCTTNIVSHVNDLKPNRVPFGWKVLLPGFSAKYAYDLGLLDNRLPFEELSQLALVNDLAEEYFDDPDFSNRIRSRRGEIESALRRATEEVQHEEDGAIKRIAR